MDMDLCGSALFIPALQLDCQSLLLDQGSDAGYHSSFSPASSVDSCCLSPPVPLFGAYGGVPGTPERFTFLGGPVSSLAMPAPGAEETMPVKRGRKSRSKYPGKKRQSASDREKMRMRDLTKELQHLRTYLPASVAPVGQTLTKIETLRLTILYISHLSAQLDLSEEVLAESSPSDRLQAPSPMLHSSTQQSHAYNTQFSPSTPLHLQASSQSSPSDRLQAPSPMLHSSTQQSHAYNPQFSPSTPLHLQASSQQQLQAPGLQPHAYSPALEALPPHISLQSGSPMDCFSMQHYPEHIHGSYQVCQFFFTAFISLYQLLVVKFDS